MDGSSLHESNEAHPNRTEEAENITQTRLNKCLRSGHLRLSSQDLKFSEWEITDWMEDDEYSIQKVSFDCIESIKELDFVVSHGLATLKSLLQLELSFLGETASANDMKAVMKALGNMPYLQRFRLKECNVGGRFKEEFLGLLMRYLPVHRSLGISRKQLRTALEPFLLVPTTILSLDVSRSRIKEELDQILFGYSVRLNPFLDSLAFRDCTLLRIDEGCTSLVKSLKRMTTSLTQLDMEDITALTATLVASHKALKTLKLYDNGIGVEGVAVASKS